MKDTFVSFSFAVRRCLKCSVSSLFYIICDFPKVLNTCMYTKEEPPKKGSRKIFVVNWYSYEYNSQYILYHYEFTLFIL